MGNAHPEIPRCHADRAVCVLTASLPLACSPFPTATALVAEGLLHLLGTKRDGNLHEEALKQPLSNSVFSWIMAAVALSLRLPLPLCQGGNGNGHLLSQLSLDKVLQTSGTWLVQPSGTSEGSKWHCRVFYHLLLWMGNCGRDVYCSGA